MDRVFIRQLEVETVIGVFDWERTVTQKLIIDLHMAWNNKPAAETDDIALALDYAEVSSSIVGFANDYSFELVETFAERLAALLMQQFAIPGLWMRVTKPSAVTAAAGVGVEIQRGDFV